jgi:hypothetical protein
MDRLAYQWIAIEPLDIKAGDLVSAEAGGLPIYRVLALQDRTTWLREEQSGRDRVAPVTALHWKLSPSSVGG